MTTDRATKSDRGFLLLIILGGLAIRLIWLQRVHGRIDDFLDSAEASRVALSLARGEGLANAYYWGQGPTAHLLPVNPLIAGGIMRLFGPGTTGADMTLLAWSLAQVCCGYLLAREVFRSLGADASVLRWGSALLFLVPPFVPQEVVDFRYWEGGSTLCLAMLNLTMIARLRQRDAIDRRTVAAIAAVSAITFFICPSAGLAVDLCWAILALSRWPVKRCVQLAMVSAVALALLVVPWAIRNDRVLGTPIALRSNFGLEFAIANNPAALSVQAPEFVFADRIRAIHPAANAALRPIIATRGGEVRYSQALARQTVQWITAHPASFARLWLCHLRQFFFPQAWQMYFTGWEGMRAARAWAITIVDLVGLIGLVAGLTLRRKGYWIFATYIAAVALPYALFQPMSRYIFLTYPVLAFLAIDAAVRLRRFSRPAPRVPDRRAGGPLGDRAQQYRGSNPRSR